MMERDLEPSVVFETGDAVQVALVRSLLAEADVPYVTTGEILQDLIAPGRFGLHFNPVTGPVKFLVPSGFVREARQVLAALR